ncbi:MULTISPECIES: LysR family transcriptional regulator [unclassified Streptomyces]|uniref:LysR family transcriptional regulator n=1 Tax=unclassified Streptomyces TaxID=2593676 RepID=UPI001BAFD66A|nr:MULTISPECIES: LysR family transcriptional regulator [unclassified Streptomyces]MDH6502654.1 DNA-binding transcriptional LysR family regulator [Streptomyces sp. SAI-149]QUC59125.1 LysR family transcriptional regulator [Streptomyces sp. A2-16]
MARTNESDLAPHELRVLVAIADTGGFSAAAGALGMTQSAVSHSVRGSERKIGAVLFERGRAGARPTPAGGRAVAYARRILRLLDVLSAEARSAARSDVAEGPLRIAAFRSAALHLLPPALERLRARHPGIEPHVRIVREVGRGTAGEVADGKADMAIATLGGSLPLPPGLVAHALLEEPYALVHAAGHAAPRSLPLVDWAENCGSYTRGWWAAQDWIPNATIEAEDDGAVLSLVSAGHGMAVMPALSLVGAADSVGITDLGSERPTRQVGYVTASELAGSTVVRAFVRELRATVSQWGEHAPPRGSIRPHA